MTDPIVVANPVDQTVFEDGSGNCLAACAATILGLKLDAVPNFALSGFVDGLEEWLAKRGLRTVQLRFNSRLDADRCYTGYTQDLLILWGDSPRLNPQGRHKQHAVVGVTSGFGFRVVHDPHPSRAGLHGGAYGAIWILRDR